VYSTTGYMFQAFDLAVQPGAIRVVVETDAMLLEQAMNRKEPDLSRYVAWKHHDKKGIFSLKSAGVGIREARKHHDATSSTIGEPVQPVWNALWKIPAPGKVLMFLWLQ
jgi:hypothetical protein